MFSNLVSSSLVSSNLISRIILYKSTRWFKISTIVLVTWLVVNNIFVMGFSGIANVNFREDTFHRLDQIRTTKKKTIMTRLDQLMSKAMNAEKDAALINAFRLLDGYGKSNIINKSDVVDTMDALDYHYVTNYGEFYDILFVRNDGYVFHSIKMENDFRSNLFDGELSSTKLAQALRATPVPKFVDYDHYSPSSEPASFFVTPIQTTHQESGWLVFQLPINPVNQITTNYDGLGSTGETYLTNAAKLMLTQSRFVPQDTILQLPIETKVTDLAPVKNKGNLLIDDYRKVRVFSSFETIQFQNVSWVLIVEIDEDEVITDWFKKDPNYFLEKILETVGPGETIESSFPSNVSSYKKVDINEYARGNSEERLLTYGVATCTGVVIAYPGQFGYLGHLSPLDDSYFSLFQSLQFKLSLLTKGEDIQAYSSDLLGQMLYRISQFDIPKSNIRKLKIVLAAVHTNSFNGIISRLLDEGIFLSQITLLHARNMKHANVLVEVADNEVIVEWGGNGDNIHSHNNGTRNLGEMVHSFMDNKT